MGKLKPARLIELHGAILETLKRAVKIAEKSYKRPGYYGQHEFAVYGRVGEPCRVCGSKIRRIPQGGRSTYFCPKCQR